MRRAFAHAKISEYKSGETTYGEAFEAALQASHNRKGQESGFGPALGGVIINMLITNYANCTYEVSGRSPAQRDQIELKRAAGNLETGDFCDDAYMVRPWLACQPMLSDVVRDPIAEGFAPLPTVTK